MRRLWIERQKATAACLAKMKVYIEDHENPDTTIGDVPCRKLGELKNGQQRHFAIDEQPARVFVVADTVSRNVYNEFVRIPGGWEDVFLTGQNRLKPWAGNPFHFDGEQEPEVMENRKRTGRNGSRILLAAIIVGLIAGAVIGGVIGASILADVPDTVRLETRQVRDLQIVLPETMELQDIAGYTACYDSPEAAVFLLREDFSLLPDAQNLTLEAYGALVLANNGLEEVAQLRQEEGMTVFDYVYADGSGNAYSYYTVLCKGSDAFWIVLFSAPEKNAAEMFPYFRQWAKTITFSV